MKKRYIRTILCFALLAMLCASESWAKINEQEKLKKQEKRIYTTKHVNGQPPVIDGSLTDGVWESVPWSGEFTQRSPYDGDEPSQETAFKILYGDRNLYVGIRAFDKEPKKIEKRLARRDNFAGDWGGMKLFPTTAEIGTPPGILSGTPKQRSITKAGRQR
jgi:hypothetical protein